MSKSNQSSEKRVKIKQIIMSTLWSLENKNLLHVQIILTFTPFLPLINISLSANWQMTSSQGKENKMYWGLRFHKIEH